MSLTVSVDEIVNTSTDPLLAMRPHWRRVRLREIASVLNGFPFASSQFTSGDGMPLIRIRDVGRDHTGTGFIGEFNDRYIVERGDLLIGMDGDFNCARWRGDPGLLNQRVCKVSLSRDDYHPRFLDYVLPGYLTAINGATSSITVKHLSSRSIEDIPLPLPPIREQLAIVGELEKQFSRLDEAVACLRGAKANLKRQRLAVLNTAVEGRLVSTEAELARRERRPYETGAELLLRIGPPFPRGNGAAPTPTAPSDERYLPGDMPDGWTSAQIGQIAAAVEYGSSAKTSESVTGIPVLRMGNLVDGELNLGELKFLPETHGEFPKLLLEPGDLLFNRTNSPELVGKTAVYVGFPRVCSFASYLIRLRFRGGCSSSFVSYFINSTHGRRWVKSVVTQQVGQANVNGTKLQNLRVPLPPLVEQHRIVAEVDRQLSIIREVEAQVDTDLKRAEVLRQAILARAFGAPPPDEVGA